MSDPTPARHPAIETAWVVDRYLLFDDRDGVVHELSPSASVVWELVDGVRAADAIAEEVGERVGADVSDDVRSVLADFDRLGLLSGAASDRA